MSQPSSLRVALYLRVSTLEQASGEATSLELQEERCRAFADSQGWEVAEVYREEGFTGTVGFKSRPVGSRLMTDATLGKFDRVVSWNISRFSRSIRYFVEDSAELEDLGVYFSSVSEQFDTSTPVGRMVRVLLVAFAEFEAAQIKERMASGKLGGLRSGRWVTGPISYGYEWNGEAIVVSEEEAEVVRRIFDLVASGMSAHRTATQLAAEGRLSPRGKDWSSTSIVRLVEKPGYMGAGFSNSAAGQTFTIDAPAIVDPEVWARANHVLDSIRAEQLNARDGRVYPYALSGRVFHIHGETRRPFQAKTRTNGAKGAYPKARSYRCLEFRDECAGFADDKQLKKNIEASAVEAWALLQMVGWLRDPESTARYLARFGSRLVPEADEALKRVGDTLAEVIERRSGLARLLADGTMTEEEVRDSLAVLDAQRQLLEDSKARLLEPARAEENFLAYLSRIAEAMPGDVGPGSKEWPRVLERLVSDAQSVLGRFMGRIGVHGPGKPEPLDLAPESVQWTKELVRLFELKVYLGEYQDPNTWTIEAAIGSADTPSAYTVNTGARPTSEKKVVRNEYADLLMEEG